MADTPEEHYTATVEVTKTIGPQQPKNARGYNEGEPTKRKVTEVARVTVRAETMPKLREKLAKHIELIDDI